MTRLILTIFVAMTLAMPLAACGKKGSPKPPSKDSTFPQQFPKGR